MSAILIAILVVAAISIALYPLFDVARRPRRAVAALDANVENLLSAREATYSAIKDLESDHAMGKLSDADYETLRGKYEGKALTILQQLDAIQPKTAPSPQGTAAGGTCGQCGAPVPEGAKYCRGCGAEVRLPTAEAHAAATCSSCGAPVVPGAKFCRTCGASLAAACLSCGTPLAADAKFCRRCGTAVAALQPA